MKKIQVLFLHGGGDGGYEADTKLADSLRTELGDGYEVHNPEIEFDESLPDFGWLKQVEKAIDAAGDKAILVGHSFGGSMLLKYLSENELKKKITGLFLLAPPFWSGDEEWKKGILLSKDFADLIPKDTPIFLYQCRDDEEIPFEQFSTYKKHLSRATFREIESGGHQFNNDLSLVAEDIKSL